MAVAGVSAEDYFEFEGEAAQIINEMIESSDSLEKLIEKFQLDVKSAEIVQSFISKLIDDNILIAKE